MGAFFFHFVRKSLTNVNLRDVITIYKFGDYDCFYHCRKCFQSRSRFKDPCSDVDTKHYESSVTLSLNINIDYFSVEESF